MITFDDNELALAQYDEEHQIIIFKTNPVLANKNTNLIEELLTSALKIAEEKPVKGEIVDVSELRGNFTKIIHFLTKIYYPKMAQMGMKKAAYIVSNDFLSNSLVEKIALETKDVETMAFSNLPSALKWVTAP